mmetsp:Transcript_14587/g.31293  ORF Transcript_14587/g.31293 Transcript_14587/m.31293 type:complete len:322 (+) Transcript_14587:277-1242(+)
MKVMGKTYNSDSALDLQKKVLMREGIALTNRIASGGQADVYRGFNCNDGTPLAVKVIPKQRPNMNDERLRAVRKNTRREVDILRGIEHENVLRFYQVLEDTDFCYLVTEYLHGLDLFEEACKRSFREREILNIARQIFDALAYLHAHGVAHRDVKLENIVLGGVRGNKVKLIDFGLAHSTQFDNSELCQDFPGTNKYKAPEVVQRIPYKPEPIDIWAMGVLMYTLCCGEFPFHGKDNDATYRLILKKEPSFVSDAWQRVSPEMLHFVELLLSKDHTMRPSASEAIEMIDAILDNRVMVPPTPRSRKKGFLSKITGKILRVG